MSEKRKRADDVGGAAASETAKKKQKRGFTVGPQNLPDGAYKRKTQEIKQNLIDRAKIKKTYAKLKAQSNVPDEEESIPIPASIALEEPKEPTNIPHPDRQTLIDAPEAAVEGPSDVEGRRGRRPRPVPFKKEFEDGQRRKREAEERRKAREQAEQDRKDKTEEREKFRRAMAKARSGGRNGQRKLGRESKPLLERVKKLMANGG